MYILLNKILKSGTEGMLCCELSQIRHALLRKDNSFKPLPIGKLAEILALKVCDVTQTNLIHIQRIFGNTSVILCLNAVKKLK